MSINDKSKTPTPLDIEEIFSELDAEIDSGEFLRFLWEHKPSYIYSSSEHYPGKLLRLSREGVQEYGIWKDGCFVSEGVITPKK